MTLATEKRLQKKLFLLHTHIYIYILFHPAPLNAHTSLNDAKMYYLTDR